MPIHLRRSVKIAPGTRLNFSKRGVSASIGTGGVRYSTGKSGNCLYYIFVWPFVLIYQLYALLFKGLVWLWKKATATPQARKISLITSGVLLLLCLCNVAVTAITGGGSTPTPTIDTVSINMTAIFNAWAPYTQTALALPSATLTETIPPVPTLTSPPLPTETPIPTATLIPTFTAVVYIPPTAVPAQDHPAGTSGQCVDGTYTSAQHKQGACSHHGGISLWWGP